MLRKISFLIIISLLIFAGCGKVEHGKAPDHYQVWGIDVSKHQKDINWNTVESSNRPHFVFLKATEGTLIVDPMYSIRYRELEKRGILRGAYHFFGHRTSGKEQALNFIKVAGLKKGDLMPVLDIEKHRFMKDPQKMVKEAKAFCKEVKKHYGVNPIIYCSTYFYEQYLKKDFKQKDYILWIADYRGKSPHLKWTFWQHTETHRMKGVQGNVDRNVFLGKESDLQKYTIK